MTPRMRKVSAFMLAIFLLCGTGMAVPAYAQSMSDVEPSTDAERALVAQHPNEWAKLTPEERQRVLDNYRRWQEMRPEERQKAQRNFQQFRNLPPEERQALIERERVW